MLTLLIAPWVRYRIPRDPGSSGTVPYLEKVHAGLSPGTAVHKKPFFVARNDSWMSWETSLRTKQIYAFTTVEAEGEGWNPVKLFKAPNKSLLTVPRRCFIVVLFC